MAAVLAASLGVVVDGVAAGVDVGECCAHVLLCEWVEG